MRPYLEPAIARILAGFSLVLLASCSNSNSRTPAANAFTVLAGSEVKDVETQLKSDIRAGTGVDVFFTYSGTLDAIDRIAAGEKFDALWVSHGKYLAMDDNLKGRIVAQEKTMLSPVLLGLKTSKAHALG